MFGLDSFLTKDSADKGLPVGAQASASILAASFPDSNTGGKSSLRDDFYPCHVDALTFSVSGFQFDNDVGLARRFLEYWTSGLFTIGGVLDKRFNGYRECYGIVPVSGAESPFLGWVGVSVASDHMRGRWCFCLPGLATSAVVNWSPLVKDMMDMDGRITRVDLALDDMLGKHPLSECEAFYDSGLFNGSGRPPKAYVIRHKQMGAGDTIYVGKRESGKLFRAYEKGCQLGDSSSPWVRYEGELHHKDKVIPWDVLLLPMQYLKGMYPKAFSWMNTISYQLQFMKEKGRISLDRAIRFGKQQVGRLLCYLREVAGMDESEVVAVLSADSGLYPMRLFNPVRDSDLSLEAVKA